MTTCEGCSAKMLESVGWDKNKTLQFLIDHGIFRDVIACSECGDACQLNRVLLVFRCHKQNVIDEETGRQCTFKKSARLGSFFESTKLPLEVCITLFALLMHLPPPRQYLIDSELGIASKTVTDWYSICRKVFIDHLVDSSVKIGGENTIVEIDEGKFNKKKYKWGKQIEGQWALGAIQRGSSESFLIPVNNLNSATLLQIIEHWVEPGTTLISECWKDHNCPADVKFDLLTVNQSMMFLNPDSGARMNSTWREVRSKIPRYGHNKHHLLGYLAEYMFKRKYPIHSERMHHFFRAAANLYPPTP